MAMSVRISVSAVSSWNSFTPKTHPKNQTACSYLSYNRSYSPLKAKKVTAMATSLSCRVSVCAFCQSTTQTPSITNCLVPLFTQNQLKAILVLKLFAMASTLRHSISAMSSSASLTKKTHPLNQELVEVSYNQKL